MTKSEAIAITTLLPPAHRDIQEVALRMKMHKEGKITLDGDHIANSIDRLNRAVDAIITVNKMAYAEIEGV